MAQRRAYVFIGLLHSRHPPLNVFEQWLFVNLDVKSLTATRAVTIHRDNTWSIQINGVKISADIPEQITSEHLKTLFEVASMPICIDNPHFPVLTQPGRTFRDLHMEILLLLL